MSKYNLRLNYYHWECGDGCCSDYLTEVFINDIEIGTYSFFEDVDELKLFIEMLNDNDNGEFVYEVIPELDDVGGWDYVSYWNNVRLGHLYSWSPFHDILKHFKINYTYLDYDVDWDAWSNEERFVLDGDYGETIYDFNE